MQITPLPTDQEKQAGPLDVKDSFASLNRVNQIIVGMCIGAGIGLCAIVVTFLLFANREQTKESQEATSADVAPNAIDNKKSSQADANTYLSSAKQAITAGDYSRARTLLKTHIANTPIDSRRYAESRSFLVELEEAMSDVVAASFLKTLDDADLESLITDRIINDVQDVFHRELQRFKHADARVVYLQTLRYNQPKEASRRAENRLREAEARVRQMLAAKAEQEELERAVRQQQERERKRQQAEQAKKRRELRLARSKQALERYDDYQRDVRFRRPPGQSMMALHILKRVHIAHTLNRLEPGWVISFIKTGRYHRDYWNEANFLVDLMGDLLPEYQDGTAHDCTIAEAWDSFKDILKKMIENGELEKRLDKSERDFVVLLWKKR